MSWIDDHSFETWPHLTLPVEAARGDLELTGIYLDCRWCKEELNQAWLRGTVRDWGNCLECVCGALCPWCGHVTYVRFRFCGDYADIWTPRGWYTKGAQPVPVGEGARIFSPGSG